MGVRTIGFVHIATTGCCGCIQTSISSISKYAGGHNRGLQQGRSADAPRDLGQERLQPALQRLGDVSCVQLDVGTWRYGEHSVPVELDAWIIAP